MIGDEADIHFVQLGKLEASLDELKLIWGAFLVASSWLQLNLQQLWHY
jgi:hypothetical protein